MPSLHKYFHSGKVLLIGRTFVEDVRWNLFLISEICGPYHLEQFKANDERQEIGSVVISHVDDVSTLLPSDEVSPALADFDVIIVGFNSSDHPRNQDEFNLLQRAIGAIYQRSDTAAVSTTLPQVLVIHTEQDSKLLPIEPDLTRFIKQLLPQALSYQEFRNSLINMLTDAVAFSLQLPLPQGIQELNRWLDQFQEDQPLILRMLRHFRFYSTECQRELLDNYLMYEKWQSGVGTENSFVWLSYLGRPNKSGPAVLTQAAKTSWANEILANGKFEGKKVVLKTQDYNKLVQELGNTVTRLRGDENLSVYLVDDVIGSGGQLVSYLNKFLNEDLWKEVQKEDAPEALWSRIVDALTAPSPSPRLRLNAVFVAGVNSEELEKLFPHGLTEIKIPRQELAGTRSKVGQLPVELRLWDDSYTEIMVQVHIIDYTSSVFELVETKVVPREIIESILPKYMFITRPREKEHPLQFEPFGWKDCGALISTHMNCPGNTVPIIWGRGGDRAWLPLFERVFNSWHDGHDASEQILDKIHFHLKDLSDDDRKMIAFLLKCRTNDTQDDIARMVGFDSSNIETVFEEVNSNMKADYDYRERLRQWFKMSN